MLCTTQVVYMVSLCRGQEYTSVDKLGKCLAEEMHPSMAFTGQMM